MNLDKPNVVEKLTQYIKLTNSNQLWIYTSKHVNCRMLTSIILC